MTTPPNYTQLRFVKRDGRYILQQLVSQWNSLSLTWTDVPCVEAPSEPNLYPDPTDPVDRARRNLTELLRAFLLRVFPSEASQVTKEIENLIDAKIAIASEKLERTLNDR